MNKICYLLMVTFLLYSGLVFGKEVAGAHRAEMGETTTGQHLYEREAELKIRNLSRIDFDELTITSAEGNRSRIIGVDPVLWIPDPLRLGRFFGMEAPFWMSLQTRYDLATTRDVLADRLDQEVRVHVA